MSSVSSPDTAFAPTTPLIAPNRSGTGLQVELRRERRADRREPELKDRSDLAQILRPGANRYAHGGPSSGPLIVPVPFSYRAGERQPEVEWPRVRSSERSHRCAGRIDRVRDAVVYRPAEHQPYGLIRACLAGELGEREAAHGASGGVLDQHVLQGDAMNIEPQPRARVGRRARRKAPIAAPVARARKSDSDVAAAQFVHAEFVAEQRQQRQIKAQLADAREVGRIEARRVRDMKVADDDRGMEREGEPRRSVEPHLAAERARKRRRDRLAPALRVDLDADECERSQRDGGERDERSEDFRETAERQEVRWVRQVRRDSSGSGQLPDRCRGDRSFRAALRHYASCACAGPCKLPGFGASHCGDRA